MCGGGAVLFFTLENSIQFKGGFGMGPNNYVELRALRLLLIKALEWGVSSIQVFGDSRVILDWALGNSMCNVLCLRPLLEEVKLLSSCFNLITFVHVYRERN